MTVPLENSQHGSGHSRTFQDMSKWNGDIPKATDTLVSSLIQQQARQQPDSQAICSWDGDLTYGQLEDLSSRLGNHLAARGVSSEAVVPVCMEKSKWAIVGLLGILKAGGTCLLLDPSQPGQRLQSIVGQTGAKIGISSKTCLDTCKLLVDQVFVADSNSISRLENKTFQSPAKPENAAYIIFTSGSTGSPKGVIIEHSQLSTTATNIGQCFGYDGSQRVFQFASYAFDACITDIFATLVHGAILCIPSEWERSNAIIDAMVRMKITSAKFTPSLAINLALEDVPTLETLILGGESAPAALLDEWASKLRLVLVYGPTECCVICFTADASQRPSFPGEIGRPIGVRAWIVKQDNYNVLVEPGGIGELLIEGPLLGRGYLNDPEKTNRQFIRNPSWMPLSIDLQAKTEYRMYRTGDLAKILNNGAFCYIGRIDNQVKIRGQRLELEEVEIKLLESFAELGIRSKQVIVEALTPSGVSAKQLAAFLQLESLETFGYFDWEPTEGKDPLILTSADAQKRFSDLVSKVEACLKPVLPAYAIPSLWIPVHQFPSTISRKTDRKRLRGFAECLSTKQLMAFTDTSSSTTSATTELPFTEIAWKLRELWAEVFGVTAESIEPWDSFFALGGDSVIAIKLIAVARASGLDLDLAIIFGHPVLVEMADVTKSPTIIEDEIANIPPFSLLQDRDARKVRQEAGKQCSIDEVRILDAYPLSPMQEGLVALSVKDPGTYILQFVYQMPETVDLQKLKTAWESVSRTTQVLRTRFFDYESDLLQAVIDDVLKWEVKDGDLATFLIEDKAKLIGMGEAMSRHTVLCQSSTSQYFLVWTVHHALVDGWSESDIISLVEEEYFGRSLDASNIPMFNRFIRYINQQNKNEGKSFWKENLSGSPLSSFPPLPNPDYVPKVERSNRILHHLDSHEDSEVEHKVPLLKRGPATAATMIQAAWFILVGIYSKSSDVITGVTLNGRTAQIPGIDRLPGPTVTTIPFRATFDPDQLVSDFLRSIQNQYLSILPFAQFGLQNIRGLSEDAVAACKFRSLLVVQSAKRPENSGKLLKGRSYSFPVMDFGIVMECEIHKESIDFRATFDHQVLSETQVRRMIRQMEDILERVMLSGPSTKVSHLQSISQADVLEIQKWNAHSPRIKQSLIHEVIATQAQKRGKHPAVSSSEGELTYDCLDRYSSRLAVHLQLRYNIRPGLLVATAFENSQWAVVSLLAILKAGGTCVPNTTIDGNRLYDAANFEGQLNATLVLTSELHINALAEVGIPHLAITQDLISELQNSGGLTYNLTEANPAFIFCGARITDYPKAKVIEHRDFCAGAEYWGPFIQRNQDSRVLQALGLGTYIGLGDAFLTLICGGCICIASESELDDPGKAIRSLNVNHLTLTPPLVSHLNPEEIPSVSVLTSFGELLPKSLIQKWGHNVTLNNMFSATGYTLYCAGRAGINRETDFNNIGTGLGCAMWITDPTDSNSLTPIGGIGELLVEGYQLGKYQIAIGMSPHLVEDPIWARSDNTKSTRRFFKTGDLASYNADGSICIVGRVRDLNLDGCTIDSLKVESTLRDNLPSDFDVAVAVISPCDGHRQLVGFVVIGGQNLWHPGDRRVETCAKSLTLFQTSIEGIEARLCSTLPRHMIPISYIPLRNFPLSAAGKIDREALLAYGSQLSSADVRDWTKPAAKTESKAPSTRMEKRLYNIWKDLFDVSKIGVNANFFQLGGGSVLALRLVSLARREGIAMTVSSIFRTPVLKDLALAARDSIAADDIPPFSLLLGSDIQKVCNDAAAQCGIETSDIEDVYPCSIMQSHYITGYSEANKDTSDPWLWQSQMIYTIPVSVDLYKFRAVWNAAVARHASLRTRFINTPTGILQAVVKSTNPPNWNYATGLEEYLQQDKSNHMMFGSELLRLAIVEPSTTTNRFFVYTIHHGIYDAFARTMLFKEIDAAYFHGFPDITLPKMNRFIKYITEADKDAATKFWTEHLKDVDTKPLLADIGMPSVFNYTEETVTTDAPLIQSSEITLPTMIEVASGLAIANLLGCPDMIFYSDRAGRNLPVDGIEDLIGPTTLFLPVRVHLDPNQNVMELLKQSQQFEVEMMPFEHLGWLELREMEHLKPALQYSVEINVNPNGLAANQSDLGLTFKSSDESFDDPFGIHVFFQGGKLEWVISFDDRLISAEAVGNLLREIVRVFGELVYTRPESDQTVSGLFESKGGSLEEVN